jgi:molybdenum cofactor synthesis domain-containing protein
VISLEDARAHVDRNVQALEPARVPLAEAIGLVTVEEVVADELVPPFDNSAVDGFAVRAADVVAVGTELRVVGTVAAGTSRTEPVGPGEAVRVMTGAPVPPGADAVVMVEDTAIIEDTAVLDDPATNDGETVRIGRVPEPGGAIRPAGDDLRPGDVVVAPGTVLTAGHLGLLATVGRTEVEVVRRPRIGVLSTGDELIEPGRPLGPGQIRDSNRLALLALVRSSGFDAVDLGLVPDEESLIERALRDGVADCDALLTSGGVSMGDFDYVKAVLARIGDMRWMQVAIKPAKPFAFGLVDGVAVFGLPGNPVSSLVSFELLARPGLLRMAGRADVERRRVRAVADEGFARRRDGKVHFARVRLHQDDRLGFHVRSAGAQGSHQMSAMASADGLAVLPDGDGVAPGGEVEVILLDG